MKGSLSHELDLEATAEVAWGIYGTLKLTEVVLKQLSSMISKIEVDGDGGVGTVFCATFGSDNKVFKEKVVTLDNEKRIKELSVTQGALLDLGFTSELIRLEILDKDESYCTVKTTIEYEIEDEHEAKASLVDVAILAMMAEAVAEHLREEKANYSV
ncbi:S-norcoclaurine synthase-like [Asparagus officinalis]|uniref:S-norcoclaurine synthase-like n=1 Tax=Asparagus officinalis TaxID=4686 RepID=UPI00098E5902|nr:S-norcoclaurine synthase-like [Asparagus officinalis]